ncbi:MAG: hypothetical protein IJV15_05560 [Lachnospiraceae bacterium]|nr:hypothetical protein [Lachnospiraceae bacterium]
MTEELARMKHMIENSGDANILLEGNDYLLVMCIGQRDANAKPMYIEFWSFYHHDKVIFDKQGVFSQNENIEDFHKLCRIINDYGYTIYDLS